MMIMMQKLGLLLAQSVAGAVTHNTTQGLLAMWLTNTQGLLLYFPVLWITAIPTGLLIGAACAGMQRALKGMIP
ncbi:MAG: Gx transporter family protein [Christensenellales bacterium]